MANITLRDGSTLRAQALPYDIANGQVVTVGAASASSAVVNTNMVTMTSTTDCWVTWGPSPVTAAVSTAGSDFLPASTKWTISLTPGWKIAAIQNSAGGFLTIMPVLANG